MALFSNNPLGELNKGVIEGALDIANPGSKATKDAPNEGIGRLDPNRQHNAPAKITIDAIRQGTTDGHRFKSFVAERSQNAVKWHIDGHDYMWALSELLDNAKESIFILDWWLSPEVYLRRPPAHNPQWRLDRILQRKAEQGVKIYVIVYEEVSLEMSMNSDYTKKTLEALHPHNITCMRHPHHVGTKVDDVLIWSHHEKVVIVDNHWAAIGGLDCCFGRWDTHNHPLADAHPTEFDRTLFPGQDYNNARITDFKNVGDYVNGTLSILESARMPWHDVHMTFAGPVVLDVVQHFVERWRIIKERKYTNDDKYPLLALPHDMDGIQKEGGSSNVQVVRSVSEWSHGVSTERSIQNAYIQLIQEAERFIYIENQFFISSTINDGVVKNQIAKALVDRIVRAAREGSKFTVVVVIPELPGFAGNVKDISSSISLKPIMQQQYCTISRGGHSIYEQIRKAGPYDPTHFIRFYSLRTYDRINAPMNTLIKQMEANSGVTFLDAQVAMAKQWVGNATPGDPKDVTVIRPQPKKESIFAEVLGLDKTEIQIPQSEDEARKTIARFEGGAPRSDADVSDSVSSHRLQDTTSLFDEKWLGTEEEELNSYVSELLYIHTKLMIVDDRKVIMGSANLNDRSQQGDRDSEIALVVEDTAQIQSTMDHKPFLVSRFATTLRRSLFREHLGLIPPQRCDPGPPNVTANMRPAPNPSQYDFGSDNDAMVADPVSDSTQLLWQQTAKKNRDIYTEIFKPVPTDLVKNRDQYARYVPEVKTGHVSHGISLARVKERLNDVRGALVDFPLDFLKEDKELGSWGPLNAIVLPIDT